jgi:hypothetical protein
MHLLDEGGAFFMYPIVLIFIILVVLFVKGLISKSASKKTISLMSSISLFVLAWGAMGQVMGLIEAFDTIEGVEGVSINILAHGLKFTFLPVLFSLFTFLIARGCIIFLQWKSDD